LPRSGQNLVTHLANFGIGLESVFAPMEPLAASQS